VRSSIFIYAGDSHFEIDELEHKLSCMWAKAITIRPDLIDKYYSMLSAMEVRNN